MSMTSLSLHATEENGLVDSHKLSVLPVLYGLGHTLFLEEAAFLPSLISITLSDK